jgi:hypothetical protein
LKPWLEAYARLGNLPADEWLSMARLSIPQLCSLASPSDRFGNVLVEHARWTLRSYDALQIYLQLTPSQQATARRTPLRWQDLTASEREPILRLAVLTHGLNVTPENLATVFSLSVSTAPWGKEPRAEKVEVIRGITIQVSKYFSIQANLPYPEEAERLRRLFAGQGTAP